MAFQRKVPEHQGSGGRGQLHDPKSGKALKLTLRGRALAEPTPKPATPSAPPRDEDDDQAPARP